MMLPRFACALCLVLLVTGCAIGPHRLSSSRMAYNDAVQVTEQRELLLNIVRLSYHEPPEFLTIDGISSQFELDSSLTIGSEFNGDGDLGLVQPQVQLGFAERPTITFTPQQGPEFARQLITPIGPESLYRLVEYGWGIDRIFNLAVRQINGVGVPIGVAREPPGCTMSSELHRTIESLGQWQRQGHLMLSLQREYEPVSPRLSANQVAGSDFLDAAKGGYRLLAKDGGFVLAHKKYYMTLGVDAAFARTPDWQDFAHRLGIASDKSPYAIDLTSERTRGNAQRADTLYLATRSPLGIMAHFAQGVAVPDTDLERSEATAVKAPLSPDFTITSSADRPLNAYLAVRHRGHWFYLAGDDLESRRSLGALISLLRLELKAGGSQNLPVLTLPVGQ